MTMSRTQLLMSRILGRGAQLDPNEEVVTLMPSGTHRQTLKATWERANQVAGALSAMGIQEGDKVASFMWNNYRHLELYQAVPSMGAVPAHVEYSPGCSGPRIHYQSRGRSRDLCGRRPFAAARTLAR